MASAANCHCFPLMERTQRSEPKMQAREGAREFLAGDQARVTPPDTAEGSSPRSTVLFRILLP